MTMAGTLQNRDLTTVTAATIASLGNGVTAVTMPAPAADGGDLWLSGGTLAIAAPAALGIGLGGITVRAPRRLLPARHHDPLTLTNAIDIGTSAAQTFTLGGTQDITLNAPVLFGTTGSTLSVANGRNVTITPSAGTAIDMANFAAETVSVGAGGTLTVNGPIANSNTSGTFTKTGLGRMELTAQSPNYLAGRRSSARGRCGQPITAPIRSARCSVQLPPRSRRSRAHRPPRPRPATSARCSGSCSIRPAD